MSNVDEILPAQVDLSKLSLEDQAMRWLVEINGGELSVDRWVKFDAWLSEHPAHEAIYCRFEKNLGRLLNIRGARALIWLTRIHKQLMTERRWYQLKRWLNVPSNSNAYECIRAAWQNSLIIQHEVSSRSSSRSSPVGAETIHSSQQSFEESEHSHGNTVRVRMVSQEAAYWYFLCVDDRTMLRSDRRDFYSWMRRSPENIAELFKIAQMDGKLRKLKFSLRSLVIEESNVVELTSCGSPYELHRELRRLEDVERKRSVKPWRALTFKAAMLAASLTFGMALAFVAQVYIGAEQIVATGANQWHHMTLPDGSAVHVDARSRVGVEFTDEARIVHVYEGSAVFDVAKDVKRPFIVRTRLVDVTAVGTRFGVSINPGVTTTVSEGLLRVTGRGRTDGKAVMLRAGEELRVSDSLLTSPGLSRVDAERKLQWARDGLLVLGGLTVSEGVAQLNRRNRTQIVIDSPALGAKVIQYASVKVDAPETYARVVAQEPGVRMSVDEDNDIIRLSE